MRQIQGFACRQATEGWATVEGVLMSETQVVTETATLAMQRPGKRTQATGVRFTPLRSNIVTGTRARKGGGERILSRLTPIKRLQN